MGRYATKDEALDALEAARVEFLAAARTYIDQHDIGAELTIDDVRTAVPVPEGIDGRVMGAVFRKSDWAPVRFVNSRRTTCHKRPIRVFRRVA
jgi:hypothetical protein